VTWDWRALSALAPTAIANDFAYNRFKPAPYGLEAGVGAKAVVTLPPTADANATRAGAEVRITDVDGKTFARTLTPA
jgi:thiosulfate dehydrogenase (quinone)